MLCENYVPLKQVHQTHVLIAHPAINHVVRQRLDPACVHKISRNEKNPLLAHVNNAANSNVWVIKLLPFCSRPKEKNLKCTV